MQRTLEILFYLCVISWITRSRSCYQKSMLLWRRFLTMPSREGETLESGRTKNEGEETLLVVLESIRVEQEMIQYQSLQSYLLTRWDGSSSHHGKPNSWTTCPKYVSTQYYLGCVWVFLPYILDFILRRSYLNLCRLRSEIRISELSGSRYHIFLKQDFSLVSDVVAVVILKDAIYPLSPSGVGGRADPLVEWLEGICGMFAECLPLEVNIVSAVLPEIRQENITKRIFITVATKHKNNVRFFRGSLNLHRPHENC